MDVVIVEKITEFLEEPNFSRQFRKYNDCRKWVVTLSRIKAISVADSQVIQSKSTSDEANDYLLTLIIKDPSIKKLKATSKALKEDETHDNQLALAEKIDQFLDNMAKSELNVVDHES